MKNPHHEKKNTLPYWLTGFNTGIDLAFLLIGLMTGAVQRIEGENMTDLRSSSYTSSSQLPVSELQARMFETRWCRARPYIAYPKPSRPVIPLLGKHATIKSNRAHIEQQYCTEKAKRKSNRPSALGVHISDQTFITLNIRSRRLSGLVQEPSWPRNYHLGGSCPRASVFVLLREVRARVNL